MQVCSHRCAVSHEMNSDFSYVVNSSVSGWRVWYQQTAIKHIVPSNTLQDPQTRTQPEACSSIDTRSLRKPPVAAAISTCMIRRLTPDPIDQERKPFINNVIDHPSGSGPSRCAHVRILPDTAAAGHYGFAALEYETPSRFA